MALISRMVVVLCTFMWQDRKTNENKFKSKAKLAMRSLSLTYLAICKSSILGTGCFLMVKFHTTLAVRKLS